MQNKTPIIIIAVLSVLALGLGYWVGLPKEGSGGGRGNGDPKEPDFLKQGLVAYYPFNGNAKDESGNGYDGKISGTTLTKDRHDNAEKAYDFDGIDDYITLPSNIFDGVDGFTISAWINLNSPSLAHTIISGALAGNDNKLVIGTSTTRRFYISYIGQDQFSFPAEDLMGEWKHIVVTKLSRQPTFIVFVDGLFKAKIEHTKSGPLKFAPNGLMIGPEQDSAGGGFQANQLLKGTVDDYRIYNRALSDAEVKTLYEFEKAN
jgi:hypothetical protein